MMRVITFVVLRQKSGTNTTRGIRVFGVESVSEEKCASLVGCFADRPDPRGEGRTDHDLLVIVILALCAVMSGADGWDDIGAWGQDREVWLRRFLKLSNGIPGHDTIRRVFEALAPAELEKRLVSWVSTVCPAGTGRVIAIDGKAREGAVLTINTRYAISSLPVEAAPGRA
jgi:hypothetical protein